MDVAVWLRGLGLEQYAPAFRANEIDGRILPELTALKNLGVTLVGHRRLLLDAIAALGARAPVTTEPTGSGDATAPRDAMIPVDAERRQLTVMFCDLVGSTALSTRLDPEDLREIIGEYHRAVTEIVTGFDGFVSRYPAHSFTVSQDARKRHPGRPEPRASRLNSCGRCVRSRRER